MPQKQDNACAPLFSTKLIFLSLYNLCARHKKYVWSKAWTPARFFPLMCDVSQIYPCSYEHLDLNNLLYHFDTQNPWIYFRDGPPLASSVERGHNKANAKLEKIYVCKQRKVTAWINRHHQDIARMSLLCSCDRGWLMRLPPGECWQLIWLQRELL